MMRDTFYLVFNKHGVQRLNKQRAPAIHGNEVAIRITANFSNKYFSQFIPSAELNIGDDQIIEPSLEVTLQSLPDEALETAAKTIELEVAARESEGSKDAD